MTHIKIASFDLDGTLVNYDFVNSIWFEGIPALYAEKQRIPFKDACEHVRREYDKIGMEKMEWYDAQYWLNRFNLDANMHSLLTLFKSRIKCYPDSMHILKRLKPYFKLVIITNSPREFLSLEISETGIEEYVDHVFSATSDFNKVKKDSTVYSAIIQTLNITPMEMAHVGDNWKFDFLVPRELGINSFYLDREKEKAGEFIVYNLEEFADKICQK